MPKQFASKFKCRVLETVWITPSVVRIRFEPSRKFDFKPGQFISVVIPPFHKSSKPAKRCYSFANGPEEAQRNGYELVVKYVPGGVGSVFIDLLKPGDTFEAMAPYGDFTYRPPESGRSVCFIATGTGIAPFRSAVFSGLFQETRPEQVLCLQGVATENEILFRGAFESMGVETVYAVSKPKGPWNGFTGRVTDYLRAMPRDWQWHSTDFYVCGNGPMIQDVGTILRAGFGVPAEHIHKENFSSPSASAPKAPVIAIEPERKVIPVQFPIFTRVA